MIGMVTQETYLFHTTIRENLLLRQAGRDPGGAGGGRPRRQHPRPDRRAARGLRHGRRGARVQALGRREAAARDRARDPEGPADPDPGRGDLQPRHELGAARPGGAGAADAGADDDRHRPPAVHHPRGRRDLRDRPRAGRGAGHARRAAGARRALRPALPAAVQGRAGAGGVRGRRDPCATARSCGRAACRSG